MSEEIKFYDGTELLSQKDIEGITPEIFMCQSNNSAGKTTWFSRWLIKKFKKLGEQFMLIYRYDNELADVVEQFWAPIGDLFFKEDEFSSVCEIYDEDDEDYEDNRKKKASVKKSKKPQHYVKLYLNNVLCGFAVALKNVNANKKNAKIFNNVQRMFMDEFQAEDNKYLPDEAAKLVALHKAVARGYGKPSRYVPVIMCANPITLLNPYYSALGVMKKMRDGAHFIRGTGWVLEMGYNESASKALSESRFNLAFAEENPQYFNYTTQGVYLIDNMNFIEKLDGKSRYFMTVVYNGKQYAIREYKEYGYIYCDDRPDESFPIKVAINTADHNIDSRLILKNDVYIVSMRKFFEHGLFRFRNLECKEVILKLLSY